MAKKIIPKAFTLIEFVLVLIIISTLVATSMGFIIFPVKGFVDVVDRSEIVDIADMVFTKMTRDIRQALPNSVRVKSDGNYSSLEYVNTALGCRYRYKEPTSADDKLKLVGNGDNMFNVFYKFSNSMINASSADGKKYRVVIYNTGETVGGDSDVPVAGKNVYALSDTPSGSHVITGSDINVTLTNVNNVNGTLGIKKEGRVTLSDLHKFGTYNSYQKVFFIDTPVSYVFDSVNKTLTRYSEYNIQEIQPCNPTISPLNLTETTSSIVVKNVSNCTFKYSRALNAYGIVTIELEFEKDNEKIKFFRQIKVSNAI